MKCSDNDIQLKMLGLTRWRNVVQLSGDQRFSGAAGSSALVPILGPQSESAPQHTPALATRNWKRVACWFLLLVGTVLAIAAITFLWQRSRSEAIAALSRQCKKLSTQERWSELATASAELSKYEPDSADAWIYRATAAKGLKDWPGVVAYFDKVPKNDRRCPSALVQKAATEFEHLNRPIDGVKTCDELLTIEPRVLIAHKQTIFFCAMTLQRQEMIRRIRQAIRVRRESPESYVYLVGASWLTSASVYRHNTHWLEADPENELYQVARAIQVYGSQAKADPEHSAEFEHIPLATELLKKYPHNLELLTYLLNESITEGDVDRVSDLLQRLPSDQAVGDARYWRARAWSEDNAGKLDEALSSLLRAHQLDPYWWQVHFQLHDLFRRLEQLDQSAKFLQIYKASKELSTSIMTLNQSVDGLDEQKFCHSLLELSDLVGDHEVSTVLRERLTPEQSSSQ